MRSRETSRCHWGSSTLDMDLALIFCTPKGTTCTPDSTSMALTMVAELNSMQVHSLHQAASSCVQATGKPFNGYSVAAAARPFPNNQDFSKSTDSPLQQSDLVCRGPPKERVSDAAQ